MNFENTNVSARVSSTLKKIVTDSDFSHKDAYELGAKIIASGEGAKVKFEQERKKELNKIIMKRKYRQIKDKEKELEKELDEMDEDN